MTHGDLASYWGAVAQIVPVVALAFVIEARVIVRRMSKRRAFRRRQTRVLVSIALFMTASLLTMSEFAALRSLSVAPEVPLEAIDHFYYSCSFVGVAISLSVVVSMPIASMVFASVGDVIRWIETRLPWSEPQKLRRRLERQIVLIGEQLRMARSGRLDALLMASKALLDDTLDVENLQRVAVNVLQHDPLARGLDPSGRLLSLARSDPHRPLWGYEVFHWLYSNLAEVERTMLELREEMQEIIRSMRETSRTDTPEFAKIQRAAMAASARMP